MSKHFPIVLLLAILLPGSLLADQPKTLKILFLGDNGHHQPADRFRQLQPVLAARGIDVTYTDKVDVLNPKALASYDGLIVYANIDTISAEQEKALLDYVEGGKGFIPLHCASYCFRNSPKVVALIGAQFQRHETGTFRTLLVEPEHPIMKGFRGFESWDETYVHTKHNEEGRTVLEYREEKGRKEPWTWVRTQGKGRVFYTAWGHDERTWSHPGFQNLVERGIRWAVGANPADVPAYSDRPKMTELAKDVKPFEFVEVGGQIPDYKQGTGKTLSQMQKPLPPAESMKHIVNPADFELKLFASEEQLGGKPIAMNWDERGRLWVAVTVDYPNNLQPEGAGHDRILVLEDTTGKGQADKVTVFADKLSIPTSLIFANGGVIVHQAPHTLFLRDTKGDGHADERKVLFTGWHTGDTHSGPSNLRYGMDNWLYGIVGYSGYAGKVGDETHRFGQGFYRFKPDGSKLEFLRSTSNNSWGVGFSEEGILFGSTANGNPSVQMAIPNRYYEAVRGWSSSVLPTIAESDKFYPITDKIRQVDYHGRFTAAAGHSLYTARTYPREYWNRAAFVTDPTGHLVSTFTIQPQGASFRSRNAWNLLASDDEWCAPVMAEVGPDGNVWVIDWYAYIVQHNPTPPGFQTGKGNAYQTALRDVKYGRIYRLVMKDAKASTPFTLKDASPEKLVATLKHDNMLWRNHAQRLLVERSKQDVVPALVELASDKSVDEIGLNVGVMHALWTLQGLGAFDGSNDKALAAAMAALKHKSAGVRRNAVAVLPCNPDSIDAIGAAGLLKDADPQVRLAALLALGDLPTTRAAAEALVAALDDNSLLQDRTLADAFTSAAARHHREFLPTLARRWSKPLSPALVAVISAVAEHQARGAEPVGPLVEVLTVADAGIADAVIAGLSRGWPKDKVPTLTAATEAALSKLFTNVGPTARGQLVALAARWGSKSLEKHAAEVVASLLIQVRNDKETDPKRIQAAAQLIDFRRAEAEAAKQLLALLTPRTSPELAQGLLDAIARSEATTTGTALVDLLPTLTPTTKAAAFRALLSRGDWTKLLLESATKGTVQLVDLTLEQRQSLTTHRDPKIAAQAKEILAKGGGLVSPDRQKVIDDLLPLMTKTGDATAGKLVFKNHCAKCHMHSGDGAKIGPDLTGMAVHPKNHLLIEIMDPSRSVEGNYRLYIVTTRSGRQLNGLLASESKTAIELIDVEGKKHSVLREDIEDLQASKRSLMPDGFEKQLKPEELVNLLEFLTLRGRFLPLSLDKVATVVSTRGMFYGEESETERLVFADWSPKTFQGVPFNLVDPQGDKVANAILLYGPEGKTPPKMPKTVLLPCNAPARTIHLLSGVSGWGFPYSPKGSVSMIVRLRYEDGKTEDHVLKNGEHFADYIHRVDVPGSTFAFALRDQQLRYIAIHPQRADKIKEIELVKGGDRSARLSWR